MHTSIPLPATIFLPEAPTLMTKHSDSGADDDSIDLSFPFDRVYWRHHLNTTEENLLSAVHAVGQRSTDVRRFLENQGVEPPQEPQ
jgi:hypothetical protein